MVFQAAILIVSGRLPLDIMAPLKNCFRRTRTIDGINKFANRFWADNGFPRRSGKIAG